MNKFISCVLFIFMFPQIVFASPQNLKNLIDDYTYSMTVEWDQRDRVFADLKRQEFEKEISALLKAGLTKDEIIEVTGINVTDLEKEMISMRLETTDDIAAFIAKNTKFSQGSNWSGDIALIVGAASIFVILVAVLVNAVIRQNKRYDDCVAEHGGNEEACIDNPDVIGH